MSKNMNFFQEKIAACLNLINENDFTSLSLTSKNKNCGKVLPINSYAWTCEECQTSENSIICQECYENSKDRHLGHTLVFKNNVSGFCDCGCVEAWKPEGNCINHKGVLSKKIDIEKIIIKFKYEIDKNESSFESSYNNLISIIYDMFSYINSLFLEYSNKIYDSNRIKVVLSEIASFLKYISLISSVQAISHIIVEFFNIKYNLYKTENHKCWSCYENVIYSELVNVEYLNKYHNSIISYIDNQNSCNCRFIDLIFSIWDSSLKSIEINKLLEPLLVINQFKLYCSTSYMINFNLISKPIYDLSIYILSFMDFPLILSNNEYILDRYISQIEDKIKKEKNDSNLNYSKNLSHYLYVVNNDLSNLIGIHSTKIFNTLPEFFIKVISLGVYFHNNFKIKVTNTFQYEYFNYDNILCESLLSNFILSIVNIIDFENENYSKRYLYYICELIISFNRKFYNNEFTYYITLYRLFSFVLNRYLIFHYLNNNNFINQANFIMEYLHSNLDPDSSFEDFIYCLLSPLLKVILFVNSIQSNIFIYYGQNMSHLYNLYYTYQNISYIIDYSLIKVIFYVLSSKSLFSISKVLDTFDFTIEDKKLIDFSKLDILYKLNLQSLLTIINHDYFILNSTLLEISFKGILIDKEYSVQSHLLKNIQESNMIQDICDYLVVQFISETNESLSYSQIYEKIPIYFQKYFKLNLEEYIQSSISRYTLKSNSYPIVYRLNNEGMRLLDLSYNSDVNKISIGHKKIIEYNNINPNDEISLYNTPLPISFFKDLQMEMLLNMIYKNNFFKEIFTYSEVLLKNEKYDRIGILLQILYSVIQFYNNYLYLSISHIESDKEEMFNICNHNLREILLKLSDKVETSQNNKINIISNIQKLIKNIISFSLTTKSIQLMEIKNNAKSNISVLQKLKTKFNKKINNFKNENDIVTFSNAKTSNYNCIICLNDTDKKGVLCRLFYLCSNNTFSYFSSNRSQNYPSFIICCQHEFHINCWNESIQGLSFGYGYYNCPLCKVMSTGILPSQINKSDEELEVRDLISVFQLQLYNNKLDILNINKYFTSLLQTFQFNKKMKREEFYLYLDIMKYNFKKKLFEKELYYLFKYEGEIKSNISNYTIMTEEDIILRINKFLIFKFIQNTENIQNKEEFFITKSDYFQFFQMLMGEFIISFILHNSDFFNLIYKNSNYNINDKSKFDLFLLDVINSNFDMLTVYISKYNHYFSIVYDLLFNRNELLEKLLCIDYSQIINKYSIKLAFTSNLSLLKFTSSLYSSFILNNQYLIQISKFATCHEKYSLLLYAHILNSQSNILVDLPNDILLFYERYFTKRCNYCNDINKRFYICLLCQNKICDICKLKNKLYLLEHTKKCFGGNGIYILMPIGNIIYIVNNVMRSTNKTLYINKYGEDNNGLLIKKDYVLNKQLYEEISKQFFSQEFMRDIKNDRMTKIFIDQI